MEANAKRAVLYSRVSTDEQAKSGYSLQQQLEALREYAASENLEIIEEVADTGWSGASLDRPGLDRVRDLVEAGGIDTVLAQDGDRFSRNIGEYQYLELQLSRYGCTLVALNEANSDDSPSGRLSKQVQRAVSEFERAQTAERTRRGILKKAREGKLLRAHHAHYGFTFNEAGDGYTVNPETMAVVRRIVEDVAAGKSLHEITRALKRDGIPTATGLSNWSVNRVRQYVMEDVYYPHTHGQIEELVEAGQLRREVLDSLDRECCYGVAWFRRTAITTHTERQNGKPIKKRTATPREESGHIAIPVPDSGIPASMIDRARERISSNRAPLDSKITDRLFELSGVFYCGDCGRRMATNNIRKKNRSGESKIHHYYRCPRGCYSADPCTNSKMHRAENAESEVWRNVGLVLAEPTAVVEAFEAAIDREKANAGRDPEPQRVHLLSELEKLDVKASRWQELYVDGEISAERRKEKLRELAQRRRELQQGLEALEHTEDRVQALRDRCEAIQHNLHTRLLLWNLTPDLESLTTEQRIALLFPEDHGPEDRNSLYRELGLRMEAHPDGRITISGEYPEEDVISGLLGRVWRDSLSERLDESVAAPEVVPDDRHRHGCLI